MLRRNKKILIIFVVLSCFIFSAVVKSYAQTLSTDNKDEQIQNTLEEIKDARINAIEKEIMLDLPIVTDNPNHSITFHDPSGKGVMLSIDGAKSKTIKSPYRLPSLGIGKHDLLFEFYDSSNTKKSLEKVLYVIPRPPVINPVEIEDSSIKISGSAMANARVRVIIVGENYYKTFVQPVSSRGDWSINIDRSELTDQQFAIIANVRKLGFTSDLSEPIRFSLSNGTVINQVDQSDNLTGILTIRSIEELKAYIIQNQTKSIVFFSVVILAFLLGIFVNKMFTYRTFKKASSVLQKGVRKTKSSASGLTIKEQLEQEGVILKKSKTRQQTESSQKPKKQSVKNSAKSVILSKEEFLETFKDLDPDNEDLSERKINTPAVDDVNEKLVSAKHSGEVVNRKRKEGTKNSSKAKTGQKAKTKNKTKKSKGTSSDSTKRKKIEITLT